MSIIAAGAYLRFFREQQGMSRIKVAANVGTSENQIIRIESGEVDTRTSLFFAIASEVKANAIDLMHLILDPNATEDDGIQAAQQRLQALVDDTRPLDEQTLELLTEEQLNLMKEIIPTLTDEEFARLVEEIQAAVKEEPNPSGPSLIGALRTFVSGWRARSQSTAP